MGKDNREREKNIKEHYSIPHNQRRRRNLFQKKKRGFPFSVNCFSQKNQISYLLPSLPLISCVLQLEIIYQKQRESIGVLSDSIGYIVPHLNKM